MRLKEKGGKRKQIAVRHVLEEYMDAYLDAAGIRDDKTTPLFRTAYKNRHLNRQPDEPVRRVEHAPAPGEEGRDHDDHSWRATGITTFLEKGGAIEMAQYMAGHAGAKPHTTWMVAIQWFWPLS